MNQVKDTQITGIKLKGDLFGHYTFRREISPDVHDSIQVKSERPIHEDLRLAFRALTIHMPLILMDLESGDIPDVNSSVNGYEGREGIQEVLDRFKLLEVIFDPEDMSVSLIGTKHLDLGSLPIATPFVKFEGDYHYGLELHMHCDKLIEEVQLYIEGKQAPVMVQAEMFPEAGEEDLEEPKVVEKKKRGRPKTKKVDEEEVPRIERSIDDQNDGDEMNEPLSNFFRDPADVEL